MRENVADSGGGVGELAESAHLTEHELQRTTCFSAIAASSLEANCDFIVAEQSERCHGSPVAKKFSLITSL